MEVKLQHCLDRSGSQNEDIEWIKCLGQPSRHVPLEYKSSQQFEPAQMRTSNTFGYRLKPRVMQVNIGEPVPDAVGGKAGVELEGSLVGEGFDGAVQGPLVGQRAIWQRLHLLNARLHEVKRQRAGGREEAGDGRASEHHRLTALLESG